MFDNAETAPNTARPLGARFARDAPSLIGPRQPVGRTEAFNLQVGDAKVSTDFAGEVVRDFVVARHGGPLAVHRISPPGMVAPFADQFATVIHQMSD